MTIRWAGARFRTLVEGDLRATPTMATTVTWNAPKGGVPRVRPQLAVETWVPAVSPASRGVMNDPSVGAPRVTINRVVPSQPDTTLKER